jgi:integrase
MAGSMRERPAGSGRWELRVSLAPSADGKRRQLSRVVRGSARQASTALARLVVEAGGRDISEVSGTVDSLFKAWIDGPGRGGRPRAASSTYQERQRYTKHVQPVFGSWPPGRVRREDLNRLYGELLAGGLGPTSVRRVHQLISAMFSAGQAMGRVETNPAAHASPPSATPSMPAAPELAVIDDLLAEAAETDLELVLMVRLGAVTAARRSELVALRWSHFDLDAATVDIETGEVVVPGAEPLSPQRVQTETKTGESGTLSLDDASVGLLLEHRSAQKLIADELEIGWTDDRYVFAAEPDGLRPWHPDTLSARMARLRTRVPGADDVTLKSLRAFVASELEADGADLTTAQAVLRHRSSQTTAKHYRAARSVRVREATRGLGERLGRPASTPGLDE